MIKQVLLFGLIAAMGPRGLIAAEKQAAQDLLTAAAKQTGLLEDSSKPFVMDVDFTAKFDTPLNGHLRLRWEAKDRWWSKVTVGPFEQIKFRNGDRSFTLRSVDFTPMQVNQLMDLLHVGRGLGKLVAKKDKQHVELGSAVDCIEAEGTGPVAQHYQVCAERNGRGIVKITHKFATKVETSQFGDFAEFGGRVYPRRLEFDENGSIIITANVTELKEERLDAQQLVPPAGAIERRECEGKTSPLPVTQPKPDFPRKVLPNAATTTLELTVLADGTVSGVHVIQSGGRDLDDVWTRAVKASKYKPAMCGAEPVDAETTVQFSFYRSN